MSIERVIREYCPAFVHSLAISLYNRRQYKLRYSDKYWEMREYFLKWDFSSRAELDSEQSIKLKNFLRHTLNSSEYYRKNFKGNVDNIKLESFPILEKSVLINNLLEICTIDESEGVISYTGGTTGNSTKVIYTKSDVQERFAMLDHFRSTYGYSLGLKTAWFSGKDLLNSRDLKVNRYHRDDYINKVRFYSTFHINETSVEHYWNNLCEFKPLYIVGFPSSIYEIAKYAYNKGKKLDSIKAIFPTAEKLVEEEVSIIKSVFNCPVVDQYASSEGAPFITECEEGNKHIQLLTGVIEIIDENGNPSTSGEMLVTSFTTHGTPLVRYKIGDGITLSDNDKCRCGRSGPIVASIDGRVNDFIYSEETGRINLGNLSNVTKGVAGVERMQLIQNEPHRVLVKIVKTDEYCTGSERKLIGAFKARFGCKMLIELKYVKNIPNEKSGKFRMVKNSIKA